MDPGQKKWDAQEDQTRSAWWHNKTGAGHRACWGVNLILPMLTCYIPFVLQSPHPLMTLTFDIPSILQSPHPQGPKCRTINGIDCSKCNIKQYWWNALTTSPPPTKLNSVHETYVDHFVWSKIYLEGVFLEESPSAAFGLAYLVLMPHYQKNSDPPLPLQKQ